MGETLQVCEEHGLETFLDRFDFGYSHFCGNYRAECKTCGMFIMSWECACEILCRVCEELGQCDSCGGSYRLGSDDHNGETGRHWECDL